jgi:acylphosphatase
VSEVSRRRAVVSGVVQGVFFRAGTLAEARRLGLSGWVRNLEDGSVEAVFEGPPSAVDQAIAWLARGPERAVVESVEVTEEKPEGIQGFEVTY